MPCAGQNPTALFPVNLSDARIVPFTAQTLEDCDLVQYSAIQVHGVSKVQSDLNVLPMC